MAIIDYEEKRVNKENYPKLNEDEVIDNFGWLIRRSETDHTNQNLRSIISKLEANIKDNEKYIIKMFLVNNRTGQMINSDNSPNISFRVDTINNIFDSIVRSAKELGLTAEQAGKMFFDAGLNCGQAFGSTFITYIETYFDTYDVADKIKEWCMFDSSVGWGKLRFDSANKAIVITNNFQAKKFDGVGGVPQDCNFFKGYVSGVLSKILYCDSVPKVSCASCEKCPKRCAGERNCVLKFDI